MNERNETKNEKKAITLLMKIKLKQVKSEEVYRKQDIRKTKIKKYIIKVDLFYIV